MGRPGLSQHRKFRRLARDLNSEAIARGSLELLCDSCYENGDDYLGDSRDLRSCRKMGGRPRCADRCTSRCRPATSPPQTGDR